MQFGYPYLIWLSFFKIQSEPDSVLNVNPVGSRSANWIMFYLAALLLIYSIGFPFCCETLCSFLLAAST